jgi:hypothetical protein
VCPCEGPHVGGGWASRAEFLRCVRAEARRRFGTRRAGRAARRSAVAVARQSSCGRDAVTRCCVYDGPADGTGSCQIMQVSGCATRQASGVAEDVGPGSCVPSPCGR